MKTKWAYCIKCGDDWIVSERTNEDEYTCPQCRETVRDLVQPLLGRKASP